MSDKMDMALDDIVKTMKKPRRGGGRGGGAKSRGARGRGGRGGRNIRGNRGGQARGGKGRSLGGRQSLQTGSPKLTVSNLNNGVSDYDINELFSEFGTIKTAAIHYNQSGRSLGTGHVIFARKEDAVKAMRQYNGVHLDGRPMQITIDGGVITGGIQKGNIVKRLSGLPRGGGGKRGSGGRGGGRGRGRGRGGKGDKPKPKTAEELDAEMDAFLQSKPKTEKDLDAEMDNYAKEAPE